MNPLFVVLFLKTNNFKPFKLHVLKLVEFICMRNQLGADESSVQLVVGRAAGCAKRGQTLRRLSRRLRSDCQLRTCTVALNLQRQSHTEIGGLWKDVALIIYILWEVHHLNQVGVFRSMKIESSFSMTQ